MIDWQPMNSAPRDGTWILAINNRGNCAVIIWSDSAHNGMGAFYPGWIHPFSTGELSSFWNGSCGSYAVAWSPLPQGKETKPIIDQFADSARESYFKDQQVARSTLRRPVEARAD